MKFGKYLQENQIEEWKAHYVHYKSLKKFIAMAELHANASISHQDEKYFVDKCEENVQRIEHWFLTVRNKCLSRFEIVQNDLPKEICIFIGFILAINGGYFTLMFIVRLFSSSSF